MRLLLFALRGCDHWLGYLLEQKYLSNDMAICSIASCHKQEEEDAMALQSRTERIPRPKGSGRNAGVAGKSKHQERSKTRLLVITAPLFNLYSEEAIHEIKGSIGNIGVKVVQG